jgi:hypothetical protein
MTRTDLKDLGGGISTDHLGDLSFEVVYGLPRQAAGLREELHEVLGLIRLELAQSDVPQHERQDLGVIQHESVVAEPALGRLDNSAVDRRHTPRMLPPQAIGREGVAGDDADLSLGLDEQARNVRVAGRGRAALDAGARTGENEAAIQQFPDLVIRQEQKGHQAPQIEQATLQLGPTRIGLEGVAIPLAEPRLALGLERRECPP